MKEKRARIGASIVALAIAGLLLPMADGCHSHSKAKRAQSTVTHIAFANVETATAATGLGMPSSPGGK